MARLLPQLVAWLCLEAPAAGLSAVAEDFRLVDADGRDVLAEAAAHDVPTEWYRPPGSVLELSFRSHNWTFNHKLHRKSIPRSGGSVVVHGEGWRKERALRQPLVFRSPSRDAVLTTVGQSFTGTVWVGPAIFDIRHRHGSGVLEVTRHDARPSAEGGSLGPSGSLKEPAQGRRLSTWSGSFAPDQLDRWEGCYTDDHIMRTFKFGAIIASNVWSAENFQSDEEAEDWVHAIVANANNAYEPQLNIHLQLGSLYVQTNHTGAPSWDQGDPCTMDIQTQLDELGKWTPPDTTMGVWHLFDDCFDCSKGGMIGYAWTGVLCYPYVNTAVGWRYYNTAVNWLGNECVMPTFQVFAHEMGHNFGAGHSFENGQGSTGGIMDYGDGTIDGIFQFNGEVGNGARQNEICAEIESEVNTCSAFSTFEAVCGNGIVEPGEDCECSDESQACAGCCECQLQLISGALERSLQCSPDAIGHGGCCTSEGLFAEVGTWCSLGDEGGYCYEGACVISHVCRASSLFAGYCGLEAHGCKIKCAQASDGTCTSLNGWEVDGQPINNLPDGTHCKESGIEGTCRAGDCKVKVAQRVAGGATTGVPAEPKPHTTATNFSGCVGFADSGFLGYADVGVFLKGKTLIQCNMECSSKQYCHSFLHRADTGFCELWSNHKRREDLAATPGYDTYICDAFAAGFDFLDAEHRHNTDIVAPAIPALKRSAVSGHTRSTCYKTCIADPDCHAFVHVEGTGSCQLYSSEVSRHNFVHKNPSEGYTTFLLPCHGRGKICPCRESHLSKIRAPCQCNSAISPLENECGINQYCYDGMCADSPKRRLSEDFCATSTSTPWTSSTSRSSSSASSSTTATSTSESSTTRSSYSATSSTTVTSASSSSTTRSSSSATSRTTVTSTSGSSTTRSGTTATRSITHSSSSVSSSTSRSSTSSTTITVTTTSTHTRTSMTTITTLTSTATSTPTVTSTSSAHTTTMISTTTTGHTSTMTSTSLSSTSDSSSTGTTGTSSTTRSSSSATSSTTATSISESSTTRSSSSFTTSTTVTSTSGSSTTRSSSSATSRTTVTSTSGSSTTRSSSSATSRTTVTSTSGSSTTRSSSSPTSSTTATSTSGSSTTRSSASSTTSGSSTSRSSSSTQSSVTSSSTTVTSTIQSDTPKVVGSIVLQFSDPDAVQSSPDEEKKVLDSIGLAISDFVGVPPSYVSVWFADTRRLEAAARRLSGGFLEAQYSIDVPADADSDAPDVSDVKASLDSVDVSSFTSVLQDYIDSTVGDGVYSADVLAITSTVVDASDTTPAESDEAGSSSTSVITLIVIGVGCGVGCQFPVMALCWRLLRREPLRGEEGDPAPSGPGPVVPRPQPEQHDQAQLPETPGPSPEEHQDLEEFRVVLDKTTGRTIGATLKVLEHHDGEPLEITEVTGGLIQQWNQDHPELAVKRGDRIAEVNGMREWWTQDKVLELVVKRQTQATMARLGLGSIVELQGFRSNMNLNGHQGQVIEWIHDISRYLVVLADGTRKSILAEPSNITLVEEDPMVPPSAPCRLLLRGATGGDALVELESVEDSSVHEDSRGMECCPACGDDA